MGTGDDSSELYSLHIQISIKGRIAVNAIDRFMTKKLRKKEKSILVQLYQSNPPIEKSASNDIGGYNLRL